MDNNNDDDFENLISRMPDLQASHINKNLFDRM